MPPSTQRPAEQDPNVSSVVVPRSQAGLGAADGYGPLVQDTRHAFLSKRPELALQNGLRAFSPELVRHSREEVGHGRPGDGGR